MKRQKYSNIAPPPLQQTKQHGENILLQLMNNIRKSNGRLVSSSGKLHVKVIILVLCGAK